MQTSVKNFTNRFLVIAILIIMAIWALLFYAVIMDEVYDNIDDGLKNQKILIIREAYINKEIIKNSKEFGINQFRILPISEREYTEDNRFSKEMIYMPYDEDDEPYRVLRTGFHDQEGNPYKLEVRTSTVEEDDFLFDYFLSCTVWRYCVEYRGDQSHCAYPCLETFSSDPPQPQPIPFWGGQEFRSSAHAGERVC